MAQAFDVIVIGSGPAGYIAAIRAAQLGLKTACVEEWANPAGERALGGTCLNVGCIPSKALLESSEQYEHTLKGLADHGITVSGAKIDIAKMIARKEGIVSKMTKGIETLFRKNKIVWLKGHGKFVGRGAGGWQIEVSGGDAKEVAEAKAVIVATGSKARHLPGVPVDQMLVCDNVGALAFKEVPERLGVIGAGVIGLELGSVWRRLGSKVVILEALPGFLAAADESVAKEAWRIFTKEQSLDIRLGVTIGKVDVTKKGVVVAYQQDGKDERLECDRLVVSVGRIPNTDGLGADAVGLKIDARGFIEVDDQCRTNLANVFAIGDVVRGPMLAHKGEEEGVMVAELIAGQKAHVNLETIPWVIYTSPEIAWVGPHRAAAQGRRRALSRRAVPVQHQRPRARPRRHARLRQDARAQPHRRDPRRAHHQYPRLGADRRSRGGHGIPRRIGGHRPDRARPPVAVGGDARGGAGGEQAGPEHVIGCR